jgi:hypothetical protein
VDDRRVIVYTVYTVYTVYAVYSVTLAVAVTLRLPHNERSNAHPQRKGDVGGEHK